MRGSLTPEETEVEFRKHYLATGNASGAARAVGLSPSTGNDLAKKANADAAFVEARQQMYARALPDGERMLFAGLELALERLNKEPPDLEKLAMLAGDGGKISFQDAGPAYLRSMAAVVDVLTKIRKIDKPDGPAETQRIEVVFTDGEPEKEPDPEGGAAAPVAA
jgi:hypothetical protein